MIGDRWTFLLIRDLFGGSRRFDQLQTGAQVSPHLLSTRLKRLEEDGVVRRVPYQDNPPRYEYSLTAKGLGLYPVLLSLAEWGAKWCGCDLAAGAAAEAHDTLPEARPEAGYTAEKATAG